MNNLWSDYGLVDAKIRASDKDLPVLSCLLMNPLWYYKYAYSAPAAKNTFFLLKRDKAKTLCKMLGLIPF